MKINRAYKDILNQNNRIHIIYGGAGAGKSYAIAQNIVLDLIQNKNITWLYCRAVARTIKESGFSLFRDIINSEENLSQHFKINKSDYSFEFIPTKSKIISSGLDDVEKLKSIHNVTHAWLEEASEIKESDYEQVNLRLRGGGKSHKLFLSFNPIDDQHWIKVKFFDLKQDNPYTLKTTYKNNLEFLDDEYVKFLESYKTKDEYYYKVYCLGEWGNISNARVFKNIVVEDFEYKSEDYKNERYGQDYGFNHASTLMGSAYRDGELYIFEEHYYKERTNRQFITLVEESCFDKKKTIIGDSAEPDRIKEWSQSGFRVFPAKKGKGSLHNGIDYLRGLPKIHIHKTNCPNAAREFFNFKMKELKDGTLDDKTFVEIDDDTIAAVRYANEEFWGFKKTKVKDYSPLI